MATIAALQLVLLASATPAATVETFTLANGLRVVTERQRTFPTVAVHVMYDIGTADDPANLPGLAHLVEHLACENTEHIDHGTLMAQLSWRGASSFNAMTYPDVTSYVETIPAAELDAALWVESERMGFLAGGLTSQALVHERTIVAQERAHRNVFHGDVTSTQVVWRLLFGSTHPYTAFFDTQVDAATKDDVLRVIDRYYRPRNAVLVLVGDLPADIRQRIDKYFGDLPAGTPRPERAVAPIAPKRVEVMRESAETRYSIAWTAPPRGTREAVVGHVVAQLLTQMDVEMTPQIPDDLDIQASYTAYRHAGIFWLQAHTHAALKPTDFSALLLATMRKLESTVDERSLAMALRARRIAELSERQRFEDRARLHAFSVLYGESVRDSVTPSDSAGNIGVDDVRGFVRALLAAPAVSP